MTTARAPLHLAVLVLLSGLFFFWGLGSTGLTDRDEGRNAEAGREMLERGDWISPTFNYEPRYAKPVLVYWLMSASYHFFGVNERAARLPSAVFGLALIMMTYWFLTRLRDPVTGLIGALMLLLNLQIISLSRMALTDSVLIFLTTLALYAFWLGFQAADRHPAWLWLLYIAMALGTLTKGPVGFLVPLLTIALYLTATKQWRPFWREGKPLAGTVVFALLALPWYVTMWRLHGSDYAAAAQANTVGRFLNPMEGHGFSFLFYVPVLLIGFFPWSGWLPFAWYQAYRSWRNNGVAGQRDSGIRELEWFTALWILGTFVFFTLSSTRLPHYIGPLFPAAAILTALYWSRCVTVPNTTGAYAAIHTVMLLGFLLAGAFATLPWAYENYLSAKLVKEFPLATQFTLGIGPYAAATMLLIGMALVGYFGLSEQRRGGAFWAAGASLACVILIVTQLIMPGINRIFIAPPQELAYAAGLNLNPSEPFIAYGSTRPSLAFYARRHVLFIPANETERLRESLAHEGRTMILLPETMQRSLPTEAATFQPILKRYGYLLLSSQPMVKIPEGAPPPPSAVPPVLGH
ncbi:ArnT family glycosyltransferase [Nitrospira moscoviensis]|uniref:Putative Glycosyl transferase, family 39 n=1 Tax=Nitrospira moscoviensis TaxID=42253 RepID=A0A0K2GIN5_NITMO|nr:glycosyltransferase family 39 protein [Nitrospira moscoviensis]ALA60810.1 putative Glycosyl transferase, family 39 [Nitrospira moscoviensis]